MKTVQSQHINYHLLSMLSRGKCKTCLKKYKNTVWKSCHIEEKRKKGKKGPESYQTPYDYFLNNEKLENTCLICLCWNFYR